MDDPLILPFQTFWPWLVSHPNCVLRAGTPEAVVYDDEDLHWHFATEDGDTLLVQVLRGKQMMGEILVHPSQVAYVQGYAGDEEGEYFFDLVSEEAGEPGYAWFFVLSHGYDEQESGKARPVH